MCSSDLAALMVRVFVIKAVRQIDERFGQFGGDADIAAQIRRASKKTLLIPAARAKHAGGAGLSTAERADLLLARAAFLDKYSGLAAGLQARVGSVFSALFSFQFGVLKYLLSGQKIDGTQE